jgi:hypothetical protein
MERISVLLATGVFALGLAMATSAQERRSSTVEQRAREAKMAYRAFERANSELYREFPMCVSELVPADNTTASTPKAETNK